MNVWRFIPVSFSHPVINMAIDMAMLDIYLKDKIPLFRIYGWEPSGFSIGYAQRVKDVLDIDACIKDSIPFVRRPTGGGVIYHDDEVTYSLVLSASDMKLPASVKESYKIISSFILQTYRYYGLIPVFAIEKEERKKEKSTLCFSSFEDYDILINGKKIGGNAQKRNKDIIMQHGSIPLTLNYLPILKYVKEKIPFSTDKTTALCVEVGRQISFEEFSNLLKDSFKKVFDVEFKEVPLTTEEQEIVKVYERKLIQEKDNAIRDS